MGKFEHGFGTQLGPLFLWRRARSGGMLFRCGAVYNTNAESVLVWWDVHD